MHDDIAAIRSSIEKTVVTHETDVVMVLHSAGGFLGSNALQGLSAKARREQGLKGGVLGIVFLTAAVFPEGFRHGDLPFAEVKVRLKHPWPSHIYDGTRTFPVIWAPELTEQVFQKG